MFLSRGVRKLQAHRITSVLCAFKQSGQKRSFADSASKEKSLYGILGLNSKATQTEIKDAYYNLTLKFHPDKNEGSPDAALKFHEITEAYEVLGNYFLRKRYDKGMPLPPREGIPTVDVTAPHTVQYQKFFDTRNLPFLPSAYAGSGGARFDEYQANQFYEQKQRRQERDEERSYIQMCKERKAPTLIGVIFFVLLLRYVYPQIGNRLPGPPNTVEHYEQFLN